MAEFNQCFHLLYLAWKLLLAANNMSKKSTPVPRINYVISRHQDEHAERPLCQKSRYNPGTTQEATATTSTPQGAFKYAKRSKETGTETLLKVHYSLYELERNTQGR
ncbi:hypothetical protein F2Q69_00035657 [Brassica cretica]|uniref:Uncharacterized protein n=1 Tax=Brassica cretica TaxID=69181 RepID=A0A8S9SKR6_BRACR|nr:hypothetical protein F2Q69_00035657 [Brassica cretica]